MKTKEFYIEEADKLLEELDNIVSMEDILNNTLKCDMFRDVLVRTTELIHLMDKEHPLKKVLYDTVSYDFKNNHSSLVDQEVRVVRYCIKETQRYCSLYLQ